MRMKNFAGKKQDLFEEVLGREIFILWFNRWTNAYNIAKAKYKKTKTKSGDIDIYFRAFQKNSYLEEKKDKDYEECYVIKEKRKVKHKINNVIKTELSSKNEYLPMWKHATKNYNNYRVNLEAFYDYMKYVKNVTPSGLDKEIINTIFTSCKAREKVLGILSKDIKKSPYDAIMDVILHYVVTYCINKEQSIFPSVEREYKRYYALQKRNIISLEEFKERKKQIEKRCFVHKKKKTIKVPFNSAIKEFPLWVKNVAGEIDYEAVLQELLPLVRTRFVLKISALAMHPAFYQLFRQQEKVKSQALPPTTSPMESSKNINIKWLK